MAVIQIRNKQGQRLAACLLALLLGSACRSTPPSVDSLLGPKLAEGAEATPGIDAADAKGKQDSWQTRLLAQATEIQVELDLRARTDRKAADVQPHDAELQIAAARSLFLNAELRLRRAELAYIFGRKNISLAQLLDAEEEIDGKVKSQMLALSREGRRYALKARSSDAFNGAALHYTALHGGQLAFAQGTMRSIIGGWGPRVHSAIKAAVKAEKSFEGGAPLRLAGRFLTRAPWPYRDLKKAVRRLEEAANVAAVPVTWLFLGDARYGLKDEAGAEEAWRLALEAEPDVASKDGAPLHRALARLRLEILSERQ